MENKNRIKILHIVTRLCIGGTCAYVIQIAKAFNNEKYQSSVLAGQIEPDETSMSYLADQYGIKTFYIKTMSRNLNLLKDICSVISISKVIKQIKPDFVFTHNAKAGVVGRIASFIRGVPVIIHTYHGNNFDGYFSRFMSNFSIIIERVLATISTCLIAISKQQYDELLHYRIASCKKIKMIPLGFDLSVLKYRQSDFGKFREEYGITPETKIFGLVGRLASIKNPMLFLSVARDVLSMRNNVLFFIVGDGELREEIVNWINQSKLQDKIILTGFIKDLRPLYADLDMLLITSIREGTPVSIIEAMLNGKIVLSTRVGGVENLIDNELNGFYFDRDDKNAFVNKICSILDNPGLHSELGDNACKKITDVYDLPLLINNYESLFQEMLLRKNDKLQRFHLSK